MSINFVDINDDEKRIILNVLGYEIDKEGLIFIRETNKPHICPITEEKVYLKNASILPWNSTIVINTSALTISEYFTKLQEMQEKDGCHERE